MAEHSKIEWTDATWNPITGCTVVSPGCTHCYAMTLAGGRLKNHHSRQGLTKPGPNGPVWTGEVRLNEEWLDQPLRWKKPRMIFVCAHGDLFHEDVPDEWIDRVFAVMHATRRHTFQVLTKRAERMRDYLETPERAERWLDALWNRVERVSDMRGMDARSDDIEVVLPNVWLGVSVEDQQRADERIPILLDTPAAVRFLSAEPLLGPVDLQLYVERCHGSRDGECVAPSCPQLRDNEPAATGRHCPLDDWHEAPEGLAPTRLDQVIVGGESGKNARPMHPDWARSIRDQCQAASVSYFHKQNGEWELQSWNRMLPDLSFERGEEMVRIGKKRAGRQLDGRTWDEMPGGTDADSR